MGATVYLLEYDNLEGMISPMEFSIRPNYVNFEKAVRKNTQEVVEVQKIHVSPDFVGIDLSKKAVKPHERTQALKRFKRSKIVHSILLHIALNKKFQDLITI